MLLNKLTEYDIILASGSPRRKQLLEEMGINFKVVTKSINESYSNDYPKDKVAEYLSLLKADAFNMDNLGHNSLIITADTIVILENVILGKPKDKEEAFNMLTSLSGKKHRVITGVTCKTRFKFHSFSVSTDVYFKALSKDEINYYIDNYKPFDKAGAYGIQEWIGHVAIDKIDGSYFNVMGLPTHRLYSELSCFLSEN
ncbi:MAG: septum formation protein Maf [Lentimicrobiaceae bacterium]|jgi:septum formation protein|nr:septum formation protein Maf [Lentimicrobiaceae bacterium]MCP4909513.1 septum formation protein Maf [Bacteroidota bacterium]MBT3454431.1 septum formation protein Maf [Lentimicrobiaceae bacterium]MBT3818041.1 septum formation protein Maf [Lentimicrobiaceae bacterium]MBT4061820.1 septum formation protein Maf [Lentimicrobiaceae bacterium]